MTSNPAAATTRALRRTSLDSSAGTSWTLTALDPVPVEWAAVAERSHPATVPGEVHTDLLAAGLVPDPFDGDNEAALAWIGRTSWSYRTRFTWAGGPERRHELVADGLDTLATVLLNSREVGRTANEHRTHRLDVTDVLVEGDNDLEIRFESPVLGAERLAAELGDRPRAYGHPFNSLGRARRVRGWCRGGCGGIHLCLRKIPLHHASHGP